MAKIITRVWNHIQNEWFSQIKPMLFAALAHLRWMARRTAKPHHLPAPLVISLTSHPPRFRSLKRTLECLLTQTLQVDRIILWIAHDDRVFLSDTILGFVHKGVDIRFCQDLRSYNKIIPTLDEMPDAIIVTADDDIYYWPTWLEELVNAHRNDPQFVLCHRAHNIRLNKEGNPIAYEDWDFEIQEEDNSNLTFPTGIAGVLYPPGIFHEDVLRRDIFLELSPLNDDIWLHWMVRLNGGISRKIGPRRALIYWPGSQTKALHLNNLNAGGNDRQILTIIERYGFPNI